LSSIHAKALPFVNFERFTRGRLSHTPANVKTWEFPGKAGGLPRRNQRLGEERYRIPVFDYNQLLALCLGFEPKEVSAICNVPRESVLSRLSPISPTA
jgi:hypothetical protein